MTDTFESGTFALDEDARTLRGILLPWGEKSRPSVSNTEPIYFERGSVTLPRDPAVVTLNRSHDRFDPVGRATVLEDRDEGIYAEFRLADTDEADEYLADPSKLRKLSAEVTGIVRDAAERVRGIGARLSGAALVTEGAFASAALFAIGDEAEAETEADEDIDTTETPEPVTVTAGDSETSSTEDIDNESEDAVADAKAPETLNAATAPQEDINSLFEAIVKNKEFGDASDLAKFQKGGDLFALGAATGNQGNVITPQYIGQVYEGGDYVQKWLPLFASGDLTSLTVTGWRSVLRPTVAAWAGDGAAVGGSAFTTEVVTENAQRYAGGNTLPREYYDFNATEFVEAWARFATNDYKRKADAYVRTAVLAAATPLEVTAPGTEPSLAVIRRIIEGVFAIGADPINARATFAIIPTADYKTLLHTGKSDLLEYLGMALGVESGSVLNFHLGYDDNIAAGSVLVGAKQAVKVRQLPGAPIRINAANLAVGAFDEALFGYVHAMDEYPDPLVLVSDAA